MHGVRREKRGQFEGYTDLEGLRDIPKCFGLYSVVIENDGREKTISVHFEKITPP